MRRKFIIIAILAIVGLISLNIIHIDWHSWLLTAVLLPLLILGLYDYFIAANNIRRQYPLLGRLSNMIEKQRHVLQEILIQNSTEGAPFTLLQRQLVYKRADDLLKHFPLGTQIDYYAKGRQWFEHSVFPLEKSKEDIRITVGNKECTKPYSCSILNVAGMSYGSISATATLALNGGAAIGNFAHNTGEGGFTPYHEKYGADVIFQFGTGYFGCRDKEGNFDEKLFKEVAEKNCVKMIEVKISQGAKPGFGAILPASKNTKEIAKYRNIEPHTEIHSPAFHSAFKNAKDLAIFIKKLRALSEGKPVGIKICLGNPSELHTIFEAFKAENGIPDFIAIDGGEGGTGAGSIDAIDYVGKPLYNALPLVDKMLKQHDLRQEVKIFVSGKIISAFDIVKLKVLGADAFYSARGFMFALGCVQSLVCNQNTCPTGITTMDPAREAALLVTDKKQKVANYHRNTIHGVQELLASAGLSHFDEVSEDLIKEFEF